MYRSYKKNLLSQETSKDRGENWTTSDYRNVDVDIKEKVCNVWDIVEEQCKRVKLKKPEKLYDESDSSKTGWEIIRVFVSSTFSDFFNEREVLVKKVFPELREWCKEKGLKLIECDLRWGVPKDSSTEETIMICLEEIDKCLEANQDQPFFITLLGDRYGWIPPISEVPDKAKTDYDWVEGTSITFMEILHGAYRNKSPNAGFFVRNSSVYENIPKDKHSRFVDEDPLNKHHVQVLKDKIRRVFPTQVFDYEPTFKQMSSTSGRERVELTGFETFTDSVLEFLKASITKMYPNQSYKEMDPGAKEQEAQWLYVLDQANSFIGRKQERQILLNYLSNGSCDELERTDCAKSSIRLKSDWDICDEDQPICVLEAPGGWGKTTLLCSVIKQAVENGWNLFYHIVGSTSLSNQIESLMRRLVAVFNTGSDTDADTTAMEKGNLSELKGLLRKYLAEFRSKHSEKLFIIIDGVNQLDNSNTIDHLSWLPPSMPSNVRCVVSTNKDVPTLSRIYEHATWKMSLCTMKQVEMTQIATQFFSNFSKKLDPQQLDHFISQSKVDNPLWLALMAEELRIFGDFTLVDKKISEFPTSMDELLIQIIDRLITEDQEQGLVKKVLCLTACSVYGLPTEFARQICGDPKTKEEVALLYWLHTQRILQPYLRTSGFQREIIKFSHEAVQQAVYRRLLLDESEICRWHTVLADFYQYWCDNGRLKALHLPKHLKRARLHQRMVEFMRKDKDSHIFLSSWQRSHLLRDSRCRGLADPIIPGTVPLVFCQTCANQVRAFNPACTWTNKKCCVICSHMFQIPKPAKAHACIRHSGIYRRGKDMVKCILCNFVVDLKKVTSGTQGPTPAMLCSNCAFGQGERTCSVLQS